MWVWTLGEQVRGGESEGWNKRESEDFLGEKESEGGGGGEEEKRGGGEEERRDKRTEKGRWRLGLWERGRGERAKRGERGTGGRR